MHLEVVTIGDELLLGFTIDTNGAWLARELAASGISVSRRTSVGDDPADIARAVGEALDRSGAVITTGGLGPTSDDLTKPAIAAHFGREMVFHEGEWEKIRALWHSRGRGEPPESNRTQAMLPSGAIVLPNPRGTAPGVLLEDDRGRWVAMLPGVPREMRAMYADALRPHVRARATSGHVVKAATVRTTGIAESQLADQLGDLARGFPWSSLAYLPGLEGVDLRLTARGHSSEEAERLLGAGAAALEERVGRYAYTRGATDLVSIVLDACRARALTIAVAESCTGGLLGERLTSIAGSSDVVRGGVIAYANDVKTTQLGVSAEMIATVGVVSEEVARAMAAGVRERLGAAIGVGITGVAGPAGGSVDKPVGLVWIAVDFGDWSRAVGPRLFGERDEIRFRATQAALDLMRRHVEDLT